MKCRQPHFLNSESIQQDNSGHPHAGRPPLPDTLTDCLSGEDIPFTNRDNIRQTALAFLINERHYLRSDLSVDREIRFILEGQEIMSLVDIAIALGNKTLMVWKCASGSLVSRERQIIASARLLEDYVVPFAVVTNGKGLEQLDAFSEKIIITGFQGIPSREELARISSKLAFRPSNKKKLIYEQRILHTYDAISCPSGFKQ